MRQRAAIARALVNEPAILLADEPTGNLDDENGRRVMELLLRLTRDEGRALVFVTHSRELATMADEDDDDLIEADADDRDWEINAVVHSHTHSEPYPSPTDVAAAPDPSWHYVIVGLKREAPEVRSYRIVDGEITEEPVVVV